MTAEQRQFGLDRGKVYPVEAASGLVNPLRNLIAPPGRLVRRARLAPGARVLELGPGPGWWSVALTARLVDGHLALCDLQPGMVSLARERVGRAGGTGAGRVSATCGDAVGLPYRDGAFDAAVLVTVLGEVPDPPAALGELARVLRRRGRLVISETRLDADFVTADELERQVVTAGFVPEARYGPPWHYTATFLRS